MVAVDATAAMLATGKAEADRAGLRNVVFQRGDAAALPFADGSFDVVVSRFALHHFEDPAVPLREMARCLRPGGTLALGDLLADADPDVAAAQNRLERLRDPSHTRMLSADELADLAWAAPASRRATSSGRWSPGWADPHGPRRAGAIRAELRAELGGGPAPASGRASASGELWFTHRLASVIACEERLDARRGTPRSP